MAEQVDLSQASLNAITNITTVTARNALAYPLINWGGGVVTSVIQQLAENQKGIRALSLQIGAMKASAAAQGITLDTTVTVTDEKGTNQ